MSILQKTFNNLEQVIKDNIYNPDNDVTLLLAKDSDGVYHGNLLCDKISGDVQEVEHPLGALPELVCRCVRNSVLLKHPLVFRLVLNQVVLPVAVAVAGLELSSKEIVTLGDLKEFIKDLEELKQWYIDFYPTVEDLKPLIDKISPLPAAENVISSLMEKYKNLLKENRIKEILLTEVEQHLDDAQSIPGAEALLLASVIHEVQTENLNVLANSIYFEDLVYDSDKSTEDDEVFLRLVEDCFLSDAHIKIVPRGVMEIMIKADKVTVGSSFLFDECLPSAAEVEIANVIYPTLENSDESFKEALKLASNI